MSKPAWAAETHIGLHRQLNEDRYATFECPLGLVLIVCDGMGGHEAGEVAATLAIQTIQQVLSQATLDRPPDYWLRRSLNAAHIAIHEAPQRGIGSPQMGTTAVLLLLTPQNEAWWAHIGDSRLYLYRNGNLRALTRDHSLVAWYVEAGFIMPDQAHRHPESNQLLLSLGGSREVFLVEAVSMPLPIQSGDIFLLCSDGLSGYVSDVAISQILRTSQPLSEKAKALIHAALSEGGYDNVTVLLACPAAQYTLSHKRLSYITGLVLLLIGIALLVGLGVFYLSERGASSASHSITDSARAHSPAHTDSLFSDTTRKDSTLIRRSAPTSQPEQN